MKKILEGVRPGDVILAAILTGLGVWIMLENILAVDPDIRIDSQSLLMLPVFAVATVAIVWRRRSMPAVLAVTAAALAVHDVAFGWVVRCGAGLPLAFALAYACGRLMQPGRSRVLGLLATFGIQVLVLAFDSAAGLGVLPFTVAIGAAFWGGGVAVAARSKAAHEQAQPEPVSATL